jgi:hypothetical protein
MSELIEREASSLDGLIWGGFWVYGIGLRGDGVPSADG